MFLSGLLNQNYYTCFWKKSKGTDFQRAVNVYYKCCKQHGAVPIKPSEQQSEISDRYIIWRDQFRLIAKIFFVAKERPYYSKKTTSPPATYVLKLQ
jgi:hypothetical protein